MQALFAGCLIFCGGAWCPATKYSLSKKSLQGFFDRFNRRAFWMNQNAALPKKLDNASFLAAGYCIARIADCRCRWQKKASCNFRSCAIYGPALSQPVNGIAAR